MTPVATEAIWAVFGGLIPIVGALAIALIIWRAVHNNPNDDGDDD